MTQHTQITPDMQQMMLQMMRDISEMKIAMARSTITPAPEWVPIREAARFMGVTPQTIRRKIDAGQIEAKGNGKTRLVRL